MRGFSDEERERVREQLVETGHEKLLTYGPRKTTVEDVTEPVGIAKSTFYRFFDSKDELYLAVIRREFDAFRETLVAELEGVDDPREGLERLFRSYAELAEDNPLIQEVVIQGSYRETFLSGVPDQLAEMQRERLADFVPIVESLQELSDGPLADYDVATVLGVMATIGLLELHRDEFELYDENYFETVRGVLITSLARGLTVEEPPVD